MEQGGRVGEGGMEWWQARRVDWVTYALSGAARVCLLSWLPELRNHGSTCCPGAHSFGSDKLQELVHSPSLEFSPRVLWNLGMLLGEGGIGGRGGTCQILTPIPRPAFFSQGSVGLCQ